MPLHKILIYNNSTLRQSYLLKTFIVLIN